MNNSIERPVAPGANQGKETAAQQRMASTSLRGVRVLDLSSVIMGPVCTQILAEYGADIVKIEPLEGDIMRHAGASRVPGMGSMFLHVNRGKRSMAVDLKSVRGRELIYRLLPSFDVCVHNMRSDAAARLGLTYEDVSPLRKDLIYAQLTGYHPSGPYADRPAFDDVIQAQSGISSLFALQDGGEPRYVPALIADRMTGMAAAHRILAALYRRLMTGEGESLTVSMFETMAAFTLSDHLGGRTFEPPEGPIGYGRLLTRHRKPYPTRDGHIAVVVYNDKHWKSFFDVIGRPEVYRSDARFHDVTLRARSYDFVYAYLATVLCDDSTESWLERLEKADIPCARVNTVDDLIDDPHLCAIDFFSSDKRQEGGDRVMGHAFASPLKGEHTRVVLAQEGVDPAEIEELIADAVVGVSNE